MKAVILHGSVGHPFENWFPWLGKKLTEEHGWQVRVPQFPTPEGQNRENWLKELEHQVGDFIDEETVIIGHSCGMLLMLNYLQQIEFPVAGSISVSAPYGEVVVIPKGGHLNSAAGFDEFPVLYAFIQENFC